MEKLNTLRFLDIRPLMFRTMIIVRVPVALPRDQINLETDKQIEIHPLELTAREIRYKI